MSSRSLRAIGVIAAVTVGVGIGAAPGCKKEEESLVLVTLLAKDMNGASIADATIADATISLNGPSPRTNLIVRRIFDLPPTGLPMAGIQFGVYVPASATGSVSVNVEASPRSGCTGYSGRGSVKVNLGDSAPVTVMMHACDVCLRTCTAGMGGTTGAGGSGAAGTGGTAGVTGTAGGGGTATTGCGTVVGTPPAQVAPPSLASCLPYDHNPPSVTCSPASGDIDNPYINDLVVSPDGTLLATSAADYYGDGTVKIWRFQGNAPVGCGPLYTMSLVGPGFIAFSPDGQYFAIAWNGAYVDIYRVPSFTFVAEIKSAPNFLIGVGFSPDSQTVFSLDHESSGVGTLYADRPTGGALGSVALTLSTRSLAVSPAAASGGGLPVAVGSRDGQISVFTWSGTSFSAPTVLTTAAAVDPWALRFSPNGQLLAAGTTDGVVRFWAAPFTSNTQSGTPINVGAGVTVWQASFSPSGAHLALSFGGEVDIWDVSTRAFVSRYNLVPPAGATSTTAFAASFSASGGAIVAGASLCGRVFVCND